jgi:hypothetical protein
VCVSVDHSSFVCYSKWLWLLFMVDYNASYLGGVLNKMAL